MNKTWPNLLAKTFLSLAAALLFSGGALAETPAVPETPAASPPPSRPAPAKWRSAPVFAADVRSVAFLPGDPQTVFAGTSAGQVFKSRDGGRNWMPAGPALPFPGWVVADLRFDPNHPERLWVALRGIWGGGHIASSDDQGKSWRTRGAPDSGLPNEQVYVLALPAGRPGTIYAGTAIGVFVSRDEGATWQHATPALPEIQKVTSLWIDPAQADTVIAGTWRRAYRSLDAGKTWVGIFDGMALDSEVFSLTSSPARPDELWASTCGWVYRRQGADGKWERSKEGLTERRTPSFAILPSGRLLSGTVSGLYVSDDRGKSWKLKSDPGLSVNAIAPMPGDPERILLATEGAGIWMSTNGAESFHRASSGLTNARIGAVAAHGSEVLLAVNHAGPLSGLYQSHDGGATFDGRFTSFPTILDLAYMGGRPFAATERGLFERRGTGWHVFVEPGEGRFEQLIAADGKLYARSPTALWELKGNRFRRVPLSPKLMPRSAAYWGGALWVSDGETVHRLAGSHNDTTPAPAPGGRLARLDDQLLFWGTKGTFAQSPEGTWVRIAEESSRLVPTDHPRYAAFLVSGDTVRLYDRESRKFRVVEVPVPARDITAALVDGEKLMVGTSGYGLLVRDLELEPAG